MPATDINIGDYELGELLGKGSRGHIFAGSLGDEPVAIKTLPEVTFAADRDRFASEQEITALLSHENIIHVLDRYPATEDARPSLILERGDDSLRVRLDRDGYSLSQRVGWFSGIADAAAYMHDSGVVHRDLKPDNVLFVDGTPKLIDFGFAQYESNIDPSLILGTVAYMSPEKLDGEYAGPASDVFSFGVMLYETLTGARPFKGRTYGEIVDAILVGTYAPPVQPEGLSSFSRYHFSFAQEMIGETLQKNPKHRPNMATVARHFYRH